MPKLKSFLPNWPSGLLFAFAWLAIWFLPWQTRLQAHPWISTWIALIILILPGAAFYALIGRQIQPTLSHLTFGFSISSLLLALLASLARLLQWPFTVAQHGLLLIGLLLGMFWVSRISLPALWSALRRAKWSEFAPLILVAILAALMTIPRIINDDDLAYLARVANWQAMPAMNFKDVYFGADQLDMVRFWLMSAPYSQAFLSQISGVPAIVLLSGFYDPFLAVLAVISFYQLARAFKLSPGLANTAVAAQIAFLALLWPYQHAGYNFFSQLSADKSTAAFILLPVFIHAVLTALDHLPGSRALVLLTTFSLSFMHPILLVFAIFIAGLMLVFGLQRADLPQRAVLIAIFVLAMLPQVVLRFLPSEAQVSIPFDPRNLSQSRGIENLIQVWGASGMYGLNPQVLAISLPFEEKIPIPPAVLDWGWLLFPISAAIVSLIRFRRDELARYTLSAFLLVAAAFIPFTGWIMGALISAWMLERTAWVYPFGLGIVFLLGLFPNQKRLLPGVVWILSVATLALTMYTLQLPDFARMSRIAQRAREMAQVGSFLDQQLPGPALVIGPDKLNDYLPALSWKAKVLSYRINDTAYPYFYSASERMQRYQDRQAIFTNQISVDERLALLQKYNVRYILLESADQTSIQKMLDRAPELFKLHSIGRFLVVEVKEFTR